MKTITLEDVAAANLGAVRHYEEVLMSQHFFFGESIRHDGGRGTLVDDEGEFVMEVRADAVTAGALIMVNLIYGRIYEAGQKFGRWEVRSEMRRALGIDDAFLRLERDQRAKEAR